MIVAKFGGTSVSSKKRILTICQIVKDQKEKDPILVVSALSGVTDLLLSLPSLSKSKLVAELKRLREIHKNLIKRVFKDKNRQKTMEEFIDEKIAEISKLDLTEDKKKLDKLLSFGEIMSSAILANALESHGINVSQVIATDLIVTNDNFGSAEFILEPTRKKIKKILMPLVKKGIVPVVTGFIGTTKKGQVTTLGRGGSDYSAAIIGFCLAVDEIQIWTDVDGIFTVDPRIVKNARPLQVVSFKEAAELAAFGAKILHPRCIAPAIKAAIPVRILNTFNPNRSGTLITTNHKISRQIKAISFKKKITLVNIYSTEMLLQKGFLARIFQTFSKYNISVDLVSVSEVSVSVTLDNRNNLEKAVQQLSEFANVSVGENFGMVSLIGEEITDSSGNIKNIFDILASRRIVPKMVSLGATNINISIVIKSDQVKKAVKYLHQNLLQSGTIASK